MKRRAFYKAYYNRTNRVFSDKMVWTKADQEEAWRKGQRPISKFERKVAIVTQYLTLLLCLVPLCLDSGAWVWIPIGIFVYLLQAFKNNFSVIEMELLYSVFRKDSIYASVLYEIFLGKFDGFLADLRRATKKKVTGYVRKNSGRFCGKYFAICRNKNEKILLTFKKNKVVVTVNERVTVIENPALTQEQLLNELAAAINGNN